MWNKLLGSPLLYFYLATSVVFASVLGLLLQMKLSLPVLQVAFAYPALYSLLARGLRARALLTMLWWALWLGITMVVAATHAPDAAARSIFNGTEYVQEMFDWIRTGVGAEGSPSQFIPQHLLHLAIFVVLSLLSASLLSLLMGAALMNYMSFYVASLILASNDFWTAVVMGWHPWSILRVAAFVILGVLLGEPIICRVTGRNYDLAGARKYFWMAAAGIAGDILMKALLAPWWGRTLQKLLT